MEHIFPDAIVCCAGGVLVALLNFALTKRKMEKDPKGLPRFFIVRQGINIVYLGLVYLLSNKISWDVMYMLIGAVLGLTLPSMALAASLSKNGGKK